MKYLIVGRSGTGKDSLKLHLEQEPLNWKFVKSYTTRSKRSDNEDTHIFITSLEALAFDDKDKAAKTLIANGDKVSEYFATKTQLYECDAYIVDPYGVYEVLANCPLEQFTIIYLYPSSRIKQFFAVLKRGDGLFTAIKRFAGENVRFKDFEELILGIAQGFYEFQNVKHVCLLENSYTKSSMASMQAEIGTVCRMACSLTPNLHISKFKKYLSIK